MNPHILKTIQTKLSPDEYRELQQQFKFVTGLLSEDIKDFLPEKAPQKSRETKWICLYENTPLSHVFTNKPDAIDYSLAFEQSGQGTRRAIVKIDISFFEGEGILG